MQLYNIYLACYLKFWFNQNSSILTQSFLHLFLVEEGSLGQLSMFANIWPIFPINCGIFVMLWSSFLLFIIILVKAKPKSTFDYRIHYGNIYNHLHAQKTKNEFVLLHWPSSSDLPNKAFISDHHFSVFSVTPLSPWTREGESMHFPWSLQDINEVLHDVHSHGCEATRPIWISAQLPRGEAGPTRIHH